MVIRLLGSLTYISHLHVQWWSSSSLGGPGDGCRSVPDSAGYPPKTTPQLQNTVKVWYGRFLTGLAGILLTSFVWLALPQGKQQPLAWSRVHFVQILTVLFIPPGSGETPAQPSVEDHSLILSSSGMIECWADLC